MCQVSLKGPEDLNGFNHQQLVGEKSWEKHYETRWQKCPAAVTAWTVQDDQFVTQEVLRVWFKGRSSGHTTNLAMVWLQIFAVLHLSTRFPAILSEIEVKRSCAQLGQPGQLWLWYVRLAAVLSNFLPLEDGRYWFVQAVKKDSLQIPKSGWFR